MNFYAHTLPGIADKTRWEPMHQHETAVADLCGAFLGRLHPDLRSWGEQLGRWHDLGKYSGAFQAYLHQAGVTEASTETGRGRVNHSSAGAQHASSTLGKIGHLFAYCIAGHHAGLPDWISRTGSPQSGLQHRLQANIQDISAAPKELLQAKSQALGSPACAPNHLRSPRSQENQTNLGTRHPTPQATAKPQSKFGKPDPFTNPTPQARVASEQVWQAKISPHTDPHELASRVSKIGKLDPHIHGYPTKTLLASVQRSVLFYLQRRKAGRFGTNEASFRGTRKVTTVRGASFAEKLQRSRSQIDIVPNPANSAFHAEDFLHCFQQMNTACKHLRYLSNPERNRWTKVI